MFKENNTYRKRKYRFLRVRVIKVYFTFLEKLNKNTNVITIKYCYAQ